jgi:hypothetical protein
MVRNSSRTVQSSRSSAAQASAREPRTNRLDGEKPFFRGQALCAFKIEGNERTSACQNVSTIVERDKSVGQDMFIDDAVDVAQAHARDDCGLARLQHFRDSGHVGLLIKSSDMSEYIMGGRKFQSLIGSGRVARSKSLQWKSMMESIEPVW